MKTEIVDIAYHLPERIETNEELDRKYPSWKVDLAVEKTGVFARRLADSGETAADLGERAVKKLASKNPGLLEEVDGLIFCSVTEDYRFPGNSYVLHERLNLSRRVFCLDVGLACSGFVSCLAVAHGLIHAGIQKNIILVTADTYSKCIGERDRATRLLFSDGAAATWLRPAGTKGGIFDIDCGSSGKDYNAAWVPAGGARMPYSAETICEREDESGNLRTLEHLHMEGKRMFALVSSLVPKQVRDLLKRNALSVDDIDLFVFHQASKLVLDSLEKLLKLPPEKSYRNLRELGNMTSASIPVALSDALESGRLRKGNKVVISGFGAGFSWASAILEI